jgi:diaminopimelate decarboxylase
MAMSLISESLGVDANGRLTLGGADVSALARKHGTPCYLMDEDGIRKTCRAFNDAMRAHYGGAFLIAYASKALSVSHLYRVMREEGMGFDVVSGGELYTALRAGVPASMIYFHGNNKTEAEIRMGLEAGVHRFVVDNREELAALHRLSGESGLRPNISLRIKPGVEAHTHEFIQTGRIDSKFGLALETGEAEAVIGEALALPHVNLVGLHCHIGSQIFDAEPFAHTVAVMMEFMAAVRDKFGHTLTELNLGGGFGIRYLPSHRPRSLEEIVSLTAGAVTEHAQRLGLPLPALVLEPGRLLVGPYGITVYTVGSVKEIPGVRTYVAVDGGMTDNPRFALYGAEYEVALPERMEDPRDTVVTVAGRCCESGDLLARDVSIPAPRAGELLAVLGTGAYNYSMASNYNRVPRPPIVAVSGGADRVILRRETYEDLVRNDL